MSEYTLYPNPGEKYKHYKGGIYTVLTLATHTETNEPMVVYQSDLFGGIYVRPLKMWYERVEPNENTPREAMRFMYLSD